MVTIFMKTVNLEFVDDENIDHHANSNANGQAKNVNERKSFILHQIPPGSFEIIFKHRNPG
jgi:hypothetical protein